jgi:hypothetical protein
MGSRDQNGPAEGAGKERREDRRYPIALDLRWKIVRRRKVMDSGKGATVDLSGGGILFHAGRELPVGEDVEISISWPALLHNIAPMLWVVSGRIVRCAGERTAIRIGHREFQTAGMPAQIPAGTPAFS